MWTCASFTTYLLQYYTKYLEGNIFLNYYLEGVAGICGAIVGLPLYWVARSQIAYATSFVIVIIGGTMVLLLELDQT